jgi:hypothetical protein
LSFHKVNNINTEGGGIMALIAHWPLNGNTNDISGNGYNGTPTNITYAAGKIGQAASFNGSSSQVNASNNSIFNLGQQFSITFWVNPELQTTSFNGIVSKTGGNTTGYEVRTTTSNESTTNIQFRVLNGSDIGLAININNNVWTHIVAKFNSGKYSIYKNGLLEAQLDTVVVSPAVVSQELRIGRLGYASLFFKGFINDVRIYDHALTDMEIQDLARAKILHYSFDDFQEPTTNISKHSTKNDITPDGYAVLGVNFSKNLTGSGFTNPEGHNAKYSIDVPPGVESRSIEFTHANQNGQVNFGWFGPYNSVNTLVGEVYTVSFWIKFVDRIPTPVFNLGFKVHGSTGGSSEMFNSWISNCTLGNWHYVSFQVTITTALTNDLWILIFDVLNANERIRFSDFQIEKKSYSTEFTVGSRTGKVNDYSGFFNHSSDLTEINTPKWVLDSKIGTGSYEFNGNGTPLRIINAIGSFGSAHDSYTISFWAKRDVENKMPIASRLSTAFYWFGDNSWRYTHGGAGGEFYYPKSISIPIGTWGHYSVVYNGTHVRIYRNGVYEGQQATTGAANFSNGFIIGNWSSSATYQFDGNIDDIRIYATALSDKDILDLYNTKAEIEQSGVLYARDFLSNNTDNEIHETGIAKFGDFSTVGIADGLVGYWPLNGNTRDLSGLNSTENTTTAVTWVSGKVDGGVDLNGTTSKIYINNNDAFNFTGNQQYTAMAMIYPRLGGTTWHGVFSKGNAQQWALTLNSPNGYLHYETNQGGVGALNTANGTILANTWYHVAIRFNGTNKQIFINGVSAATQTATALNSASNTEVLRIGEGNTGELFNGIIDEVKVFNRALTDEEMMIEYNTMFNNQVQIHESGVVYAKDLEQY